MSYKMITFDVDGTLLNSKLEISPRTVEMIEKAHAAGKIVALSTGRSVAECRHLFPLVPHLKYGIFVSGALIYDVEEKKVLYRNPIAVEDVRYLLDNGHRDETMVHFLSTESIVERDRVVNLARYDLAHHQPMFNKITIKVDNIFDYYEADPFPIEKINFFNTSDEIRREIKASLNTPGINMTDGEGYTIEFTAKGVTKGSALKKLCEILNIAPSEVISVGDGDNDVDILKTAGIGIAMGNAPDFVKEHSDAVVSDNNHDGCAEAIEKYLLGDAYV